MSHDDGPRSAPDPNSRGPVHDARPPARFSTFVDARFDEQARRRHASDAVLAVNQDRAAVVGQHRRRGCDEIDGQQPRLWNVTELFVLAGRAHVEREGAAAVKQRAAPRRGQSCGCRRTSCRGPKSWLRRRRRFSRRRDERGHARKAGGVVGAARALVARHQWIRAQRPRAIDLAVRAVRGDQLVGRHAFLHPLFERADRVELVRPGPAGAVPHAGRHEEPRRNRASPAARPSSSTTPS